MGKARNLKAGVEGEMFVFSKLDELTAYVQENKKDGGNTKDELKTLIGGWITAQEKQFEKERAAGV